LRLAEKVKVTDLDKSKNYELFPKQFPFDKLYLDVMYQPDEK
jgi:hypothetical protein